MPPTTSFDFGDVVLVPFPFTDQSAAKKRPAVVVSSAAYNRSRLDVVLIAITSQIRHPLNFGEILVGDWRKAGLLAPSIIKPLLMTLEKGLVLKRLGHLEGQDRAALQKTLQQILNP
jgi:mRNA interferase MazF